MGCIASLSTMGAQTSKHHSGGSHSEVPTFHSKYRRGKDLGKGGYSIVYEAIDRKTGKKYAAKQFVKAKLKPDDEIGLKQEIEILSKLEHNNIVKFFDFFDDADHYFVVLELLEGGELFDRIVKKSCYTEKEARDLVYILLNAIKYIHDNDVVHRDLKPENLLLASKRDDTTIKIADFGFAKRAHGNSLTSQCGSPGYVAPEILEGKKYGKSVDMWSAGVITYILLGGYPPFQDDRDQAALFRKIRRGQYQFHPEYWNHISDEAIDLIKGLLTLDPKKRLTVDQALIHPWLGKQELETKDLAVNLQEFKRFHATRKFRAAAKAVIAIKRMSRSFSDANADNVSVASSHSHHSEPSGDSANPICDSGGSPVAAVTSSSSSRQDQTTSSIYQHPLASEMLNSSGGGSYGVNTVKGSVKSDVRGAETTRRSIEALEEN